MTRDLLENEYCKIVLDDNIMECKFKVKFITLEIAKACVKARISVSEQKSQLVLIDMREVSKVPKEVREYLATPYSQRFIKVGALFVGSKISRIIGNFFFYLCKPSCPCQLFTNRKKAIQWLKQME